MFARKMMIAGLQKQQNLLNELIQTVENKSSLEVSDVRFCKERTKDVARNLRQLRRIKSDYAYYLDLVVFS